MSTDPILLMRLAVAAFVAGVCFTAGQETVRALQAPLSPAPTLVGVPAAMAGAAAAGDATLSQSAAASANNGGMCKGMRDTNSGGGSCAGMGGCRMAGMSDVPNMSTAPEAAASKAADADGLDQIEAQMRKFQSGEPAVAGGSGGMFGSMGGGRASGCMGMRMAMNGTADPSSTGMGGKRGGRCCGG